MVNSEIAATPTRACSASPDCCEPTKSHRFSCDRSLTSLASLEKSLSELCPENIRDGAESLWSVAATVAAGAVVARVLLQEPLPLAPEPAGSCAGRVMPSLARPLAAAKEAAAASIGGSLCRQASAQVRRHSSAFWKGPDQHSSRTVAIRNECRAKGGRMGWVVVYGCVCVRAWACVCARAWSRLR